MKNWKVLIALAMAAFMVFAAAACGNKEESKADPDDPANGEMVELSEDQMDDLYQQAALKTLEERYSEYMPDKVVGFAEPFSIERTGDKGTWDVYLCAAEYVAFDGKAYDVSGSYGEAIIEFDYTDNGPVVTDVIWADDGTNHDKWIEERFNEEGIENWKKFSKDEKNRDFLIEVIEQKAEDELGVPVDKDLVLEIDEGNGSYELYKVNESGSPEDDTYEFDTETVKKGKLTDLQ